MAVISLDCPNCGAKLSPDDSKRSASCEYCGAEFKIARTVAEAPPRRDAPQRPFVPTTAIPPGAATGARRAMVFALAVSVIGVGGAMYFTANRIDSTQPLQALRALQAVQTANFLWDTVGGPPTIVTLDGAEHVIGRIRQRDKDSLLHIAVFNADTGDERYRVGPLGSYSDGFRSTHFAVLGDRLVVTDYRGKLLVFALATGAPLGEVALTDRAEALCLFEEDGEERLYLAQVDEREFLVDIAAPTLKEATLPPTCDKRVQWGRDGDPVATSDARVKLAPAVDGVKVQAVHVDGSLAVARAVKAPGTATPMAFGFDPESREVRWRAPVPAVDLASVRERDNNQDTLAGGRYFATYGEGREHWHLTAFDAESGARLWDNKLRSIFAVDWLHGIKATEEHVFLVRMHTVEIYDAATGTLKTTLSSDSYDG